MFKIVLMIENVTLLKLSQDRFQKRIFFIDDVLLLRRSSHE